MKRLTKKGKSRTDINDSADLFGPDLKGVPVRTHRKRDAESVDFLGPVSSKTQQIKDPINVEAHQGKLQHEKTRATIGNGHHMTPQPIPQACHYPILEAVVAQRGLELKAIWTLRDVARIFDVAVRTLQDWTRDGKLFARNLPGRGRFLSQDLEEFLLNSASTVTHRSEDE